MLEYPQSEAGLEAKISELTVQRADAVVKMASKHCPIASGNCTTIKCVHYSPGYIKPQCHWVMDNILTTYELVHPKCKLWVPDTV